MIPSGISFSLLSDLLRIGGIWRNLKTSDVPPTMKTVLERLKNTDSEQMALLKKQVDASETLHWAPLGEGVAMPHLRLPSTCGNDSGLFAILELSESIPLPVPPPDGLPVKQLLFFVSPSARTHIQIVSQISMHLIHGPFKRLLTEGAADEEIVRALAENPRSR